MKPKKALILAILLSVFAANSVFAQTMLDTRMYAEIFGFRNGTIDFRSQYIWAATDEEIDKFGALNIDPKTAQDGDTRVLTDIPLEFALLSYYSPAVRDIRPAEAAAMLPADNPRLSGQKLGAAVYMDMVVLRFLGDTAAIARYEAMLTYIQTASNVTRAEIEQYYRNNIRPFIAEIVDEEFGKISFLSQGSPNGSYNAVLTRNPQNGQYILSYEGYFNGTLQTKTLPIASLEALPSEMSRNSDFNQTSIDQVRTQAALIPAVTFSQQTMSNITEYIYDFYVNPTQRKYDCLRDVLALYLNLRDTTGRLIFDKVVNSYANVLRELNPALEAKVSRDAFSNRNYVVLTAEQRQRLSAFR